MTLARRQFLVGSAALAAAGSVRAQGTVVTPGQFGAVGDLDGDAGTDDTQAFRRMAAHLGATAGHALITRRHRITGGFALFSGTLEFADGALVRNTTRVARQIWPGTCLFVGTYFGVSAPSGLNAEPQQPIFPLAAGADRFRFAAGRVPPRFAPGALVYLKDGRRYPGARLDFRIASHVSVVSAVEGNTVIIRHPAPLAIGGTRDQHPTVLTPSDAIPLHPALGVPAPVTRLARGVRVINGAFESAETTPARSQTVHVACHDCDLEFRWLSGSNCLGINPCSDSRIVVRDARFTNVLYELAYFHARVRGEVIRGARMASPRDNMAGSGKGRGVPPVAISEYGHSVRLDRVEVTDRPAPGDADRASVGIYAPLTSIGALRIADAGATAVTIGSRGTRGEGTRIDSLEIRGGGRVSVLIDSPEVSLGRVDIAGLRAANAVPVLHRPRGLTQR